MKMYRRSRSQVATLVLLALVAMASWSLQGSQSGATLPAAGSARMGNSSFSAPAALAGAPGVGVSNTSHPTVVGQSLKNDVSPALRDIKPVPPVARATGREADDKGLRLPIVGHKDVADSVVQTGFGPPGASVSPMIPSPTGGWDGINMANGCGGCQPPDTNGQVGPNHFLQMVNSAFQIWNKSGTSLYGPANINTVWSGFGGLCETTNDGDPVALYDQLANRWLVSQFAFAISGQNPVAPYYQCIAVSQTADPTGAWYRYSFLMSNNAFPDYPKLSVWPDAYYMTINSFPDAGGNPTGMPYAFNRSQMLTGAATTFQTTGGSSDVLLPSNVDGTTLPPAGAPAYFLGLGSGLDFYKFHVDWNNSANTTFTGPTTLTPAGFTQLCPSSRGCVAQPGTTNTLDGLGDRLMFRLAYRNFGDHEALVVDHAVDAGSGKAGMRWYEIRNPAGTPTIYQQGTYAPDAASRWGGSIALDHVGDMAMGYSASSSSVSPAVRYTGRLVGDALGSMAQGEGVFAAGTGSQSSGNRWGDYSDMTVDPSDDCTFWYTSEYVDSAGNWKTRIGNFKFATCSSGPTPTPTNTPIPGPTNTPTPAPPPGTIQNGGFETGSVSSWTVDGSLPAPVASTTQKHAGSYSALLGATSGNEPNGDSSLYQSFTVPSGGGTLSFWYRPTTADTISYDWQDAYLQNSSGSTVATLLHVASNTQVWTNVTYNLASYAGQTMRIKFLVHEDGCTCNDLTSMYVDDVTVSGAGPTPTNTPVPPTNTPAPPTNTPVPPTNTPTPGASVVSNGGFETGSFSPWVIASTLPSPAVTTAKAHTGTHSALLGTTSGSEPNGDGAFYQTVTVPASGGTLSFWYLPASADSISYDWQDAYVTDTSGNVLATVLHVCSNTQAWTNVNFSMAAYAGQTVRIKFLVHQDGYGDLTSMYVDDVSVH